jgi:hypothetical protein
MKTFSRQINVQAMKGAACFQDEKDSIIRHFRNSFFEMLLI